VFKNRAKTGSTVAIFNSMKDADDAFEQLEGVLAMVWHLFCHLNLWWLSPFFRLKLRCSTFISASRCCILDEL
jgi:hypothetical protein